MTSCKQVSFSRKTLHHGVSKHGFEPLRSRCTQRCIFFFPSKFPVNEPPPCLPIRPPTEIADQLQDQFYISLKLLIKVSLNKIIFFSLLSKERGLSLCSPKAGPLWEETPISLLSISFGVPSKGALPPGSRFRAPPRRQNAPLLGPHSSLEGISRLTYILTYLLIGAESFMRS